jgi:hypothetical protein
MRNSQHGIPSVHGGEDVKEMTSEECREILARTGGG